MLFPKFYFFQCNKNASCNNSNILQDAAVSIEISYCEDINVHFLLWDRFGFSFVGILLAGIYGAVILLYIAKSFCYSVQPL